MGRDLFSQPDWPLRFALSQRKPQSKEELNRYIETFLGFRMADTSVCPEHVSPLDVLWLLFSEQLRDAVIVANRGGGKTQMFATLHLLNGKFKPLCATAHMGAVEAQAGRCYDYFVGMVTQQPFVFDLYQDPIRKSTAWKNGSKLEVLAGTMAQASGPHPQKSFVDEVEQMAWNVWQQFNKTPMTKHGIPAQLIAGSTYQEVGSTLHRIVENGKTKILTWCWLEVVEKCTRPLEACQSCGLKEVCYTEGMPARRSNGFIKIEDMEDAASRSDIESWKTQMACKRPGVPMGRTYYNYDVEGANNIWGDQHIWETRPLLLCCDFNHTPLCWEISQIQPNSELHFFDEICLRGAGSVQAAQEFVRRYAGHKAGYRIYGDASGHGHSTKTAQTDDTDYTLMMDVFRALGKDVRLLVPTENPAIKKRLNSMNAAFLNLNGFRRIKVNPDKCKMLHNDLLYQAYHPGTMVLDERDPERGHAAAAAGYLITYEFPVAEIANPSGRIGVYQASQLQAIAKMYGGH